MSLFLVIELSQNDPNGDYETGEMARERQRHVRQCRRKMNIEFHDIAWPYLPIFVRFFFYFFFVSIIY